MVEMASNPDEVEEEAAPVEASAAALADLRAQLATAVRRCAELDAARAAADVERAAAVTSWRAAEDALIAERDAGRAAVDALATARLELEEEVALVAARTQELATESELRAAAEARAIGAEQERDALASEVAEAFRLLHHFEQQADEQQRRADAQLAEIHAEIQATKNELEAARAAPAGPLPAKRAKELSKKWRR